MKKIVVLAIALSFILAGTAFAAPNYQEGLWEMTTIVNIQGMPRQKSMHPMKQQVCMTKQNAVPQPKEKGEQQCSITDQKTAGDKVSWTMTCRNGTVSKGEITYSKTSFSGSQTTTTTQGGMKAVIKSTMSGKYIGPCPK